MSNIVIQQVFPNAENKAAAEAVTAESLVIALSDIPAVSAAEANVANGKASEVLRGICEQAHKQITALDQNAQPTNMTIAKNNTAIGLDTMRYTYTFTFDVVFDPDIATPVAEQ